MTTERQTPKIRFTGFSEDWVEKELGSIAQFSKGSGYSKADLRVDGSPIILYGRLYTKYQTVINKVDTFVDEKINSVKSQGNEIIVPASGETAEDIARASAVTQKDIILGGDLNIVRLNDSDSPTFIALKISHGKSKLELAKKAQGKSVVHVRNSDLQSLLLNLPSLKEQTAIGNLFQNIDQTITLQRRKHEQTQTLKKSLLSKMFPKKGQSQPEIRLTGFSGDWVEKTIGNISNVFSGGTPSVGRSEYYGGGIPFIRSGEVSSHKTELFLTEEGLLNSSAKLVARGDVLYALYGATSGEVSISKINGAINQAILAIIPSKGYNSEFIAYWLRVNKGNIVNTYLQGGQGNLSGGIIKSLLIKLPSFKEQTAIGQFFKQLDDTISLQAKQLKTLDNLKKALLAKMFV